MIRWNILILGAGILGISMAQANEEKDRYWPQWRGPLATGEAPLADPPVEWSEGNNIRWKTELPGLGHSTPVIWGHHIFLTSALPYGDDLDPMRDHAPGSHGNLAVTHRHRFLILAVHRGDGKILWQRTAREALPHEGGYVTGSLASNSPVTDGERVYAFFGSRGLYAYTVDGEALWEKDLGLMHTRHAHGEGSSPVLYGDTLLLNWDHEGDSFLYAFDKHTGDLRWKVARDEKTSWSTPIVVEYQGQPQAVVSATNKVRGYDLKDGDLLWECGGLSRNVVASPVYGDGMVFVSNSYDWRILMAIRLEGARGDITGTANVVWTHKKNTSYVPSLLLYRNVLYMLSHNQGILSRLDAGTGRPRGKPFRLGSIHNVYASPVAAAGRVYVTDRDGTTAVLTAGSPPEMLAINQLDDHFSASAALVDDSIILRGRKTLYCIAEDPSAIEATVSTVPDNRVHP